MFQMYTGTKRGLGESPEKEVYAKVYVKFRRYLHCFPGALLHVFLAIMLHMDEDGLSYPSYDLLAKETGYGRDSISRALKALCDLEIDGHRVLMRWREKDDEGKYTTGNRYKVFPTAEELTHSPEKPTMDEANYGESGLEVAPCSKENHKDSSPAQEAAPDAPRYRDTSDDPLDKLGRGCDKCHSILSICDEGLYCNECGWIPPADPPTPPKPKRGRRAAKASTPKPAKPTVPRAQLNPMIDALVAAFHLDPDRLTEKRWSSLRGEARQLCLAGYDPEIVALTYALCKARKYENFTEAAITKYANDADRERKAQQRATAFTPVLDYEPAAPDPRDFLRIPVYEPLGAPA